MRCHYCHEPAELVTGREIYGSRRADLEDLKFYRCVPCAAHVGCHKGTDRPLGRLANAELRAAKSAAHAAFDPCWKRGLIQRKKAYAWLAKEMGMPKKECHIGWMDLEQCRRVVEICQDKEARNRALEAA